MGAFIEILIEGIKKFGGEIFAAVLLAAALCIFFGLRKIFTKKNYDYEFQRELEERRRVEEQLKAELKQREEALRQAEAQKAKEARHREKLQRQLEAQNPNVQAQISVKPPDVKVLSLFEQGKKYYDSQKYKEAELFIRKAAKLGYAEAQYRLGRMYELGKGVKQDYAKAVKWYLKAAKQGDKNAKKALGWL